MARPTDFIGRDLRSMAVQLTPRCPRSHGSDAVTAGGARMGPVSDLALRSWISSEAVAPRRGCVPGLVMEPRSPLVLWRCRAACGDPATGTIAARRARKSSDKCRSVSCRFESCVRDRLARHGPRAIHAILAVPDGSAGARVERPVGGGRSYAIHLAAVRGGCRIGHSELAR